jgi:VWFA-related protein
MTRGRLAALGCVLLVSAALPPAQSRQVFKAGDVIVTVDAGVFDGARPVLGLNADDFELDDNGVRQTIEMVDIESLPLDLTLVVDTSGSVEPILEEIRAYVRDAADLLRLDDRIRLITFSGEVRDVFGLQPAMAGVPVEAVIADGATALYDAAIAALMRTRAADRRQFVMVITDGFETNSGTTADDLIEVARRSDSVLQIFVARPVGGAGAAARVGDTRGYWLSSMEYNAGALGRAARLTGGALTEVATRHELPARFRMALEEFRTSVVLRYRPAGVTPGGWHNITVKVRGGRYSVRARSGYFWRQSR